MEGCVFFFFFLPTPLGNPWLPRSLFVSIRRASSVSDSATIFIAILENAGFAVKTRFIDGKFTYLTVERRITVSMTSNGLEVGYRVPETPFDAEINKRIERQILFIAEQAIAVFGPNQTRELRIRSRYSFIHPDPDGLFVKKLIQSSAITNEYGYAKDLEFSFAVNIESYVLRISLYSFPKGKAIMEEPHLNIMFEQIHSRKNNEQILSILRTQDSFTEHRLNIVRSLLGDEL